jgi:prolyl-tRNA editing enzyme YbaK/EbsC (Cys-tRNA(Pro) deacylase)
MLKDSAQQVQDFLDGFGFGLTVVEMSQTTRSAEEAAAAIGTKVEQIAKSLVFLAGESPVLVIASGANRVDTKKLQAILSKLVRRATPEEVKRHTGFAIGGVPPAGHSERLQTFIDRHLMCFAEVYAAAGHPNAVVRLTPEQLRIVTDGNIVDVAEVSGQS